MLYNRYNKRGRVIKMSYTMSYDASIKCKQGDVKGLMHHNARDVDVRNNLILNHSNECIDSAYTSNNQTYFYNHKTGEFEKCTDLNQINDALQERLKAVKRPLRRDAVVLRSLILQLDPAWYEEHMNEDERQYSYECMIDWVCEVFGEQNIISFSIHEDETNPHIHVSFCPVTEDGRLSQKDFIDKFKLKEQHHSLRQYMTEKGFDIAMENQKPGKYAKRMSVEEYKDFAELQSEHEILDSAFRHNVKRQAELDKKAADLAARDGDLKLEETSFQERLEKFSAEAESCRAELMRISSEYWNQPSGDDALTHFAKSVKAKNGRTIYDMYLIYREKEKIRTKEAIYKQRALINKFEDIARQAERSTSYDSQFEL